MFAPLDKAGSFKITTDKGFSALVKVKAPKTADVSWSGPNGGDAAANSLESAIYESGCWFVDRTLDPTDRTVVCAWSKDARLFLGPTPAEPPSLGLAWGERDGMDAQILSSAGLGTDNATLTAVKDRNGAIIWCRSNSNYTMECIEGTLKDTGSALGKAILHANCKTKKFTDYRGRNLEALDDDILNLDTNEKLGNSASSGSTVALSAFNALCPEKAK